MLFSHALALVAALVLTSSASAEWKPPANTPGQPPSIKLGDDHHPAPPAPVGPTPPAPHGPAPNEIYRFKHPTRVVIGGVGGCHIRPQCAKDFTTNPFSGGKYHKQLIVCAKPKSGKPTSRKYQWKALPCKSEKGKKHGLVRFKSLAEHEGEEPLFLCMTRARQYWPSGGSPVHFAMLKTKSKQGCTWQVRKVKVFNFKTKSFCDRHVFINWDHGRFMLRKRAKCDPQRPLFAIQTYQCEAKVDRLGSFVIKEKK